MTRAALYARYSSHAQKDTSIEQQFDDLERYCAEKGYSVVARYADRAMSGTTSDRPQYQRMLKDADRFDVVVCWKVDRFARNREDAAMGRVILKQHGVRVEYCMESVEDTPEGALLEGLLESIAEFYSKSLAQNVRRGLQANFREGKSTGGMPLYGYKLKDGKVEIDPVTAPIVQEIFQRYVAGEEIKTIYDSLNSRGIRTSSGGEWNKNSFKRMLKNEKYRGVYTYAGERLEGGWPRIIDDDTFSAACERMSSSARGHRSKYLLSGILRCGVCGSMMVGTCGYGMMGTKYEYYTCKDHTGGHESHSEARSELDSLVINITLDTVLTDDLVEQLAEECHEIIMELRESDSERVGLESEIAEVSRKRDNVANAIEEGANLVSRYNELDSELESLQSRLATLDDVPSVSKEEIVSWLTKFRDGDIDDRAYQEAMVHAYVHEVTVYDDHLDIVFYADDGVRIGGRWWTKRTLGRTTWVFGPGWFGASFHR